MTRRSILHIKQILEWADAHFERTGEWPNADSGLVWEDATEKWRNIDNCLLYGLRGLRAKNSLARLLAKHRGKRNRKALPKYSSAQILRWADAHRKATGKWPNRNDGAIDGAPGETWRAVEAALNHGTRGMPGGSSIARLLQDRRSVKNRKRLPRVSIRKILSWADAHHTSTGKWPTMDSGIINGTRDETWNGINHVLKRGRRGLRGGTTLCELLRKHRGVDARRQRPPLSVDQILKCVDAHFARTGKWPKHTSGKVVEAPGETWHGINAALVDGKRGMPGGESLEVFVARHRNLRTKVALPTITKQQIKSWVRAFHNQHGHKPTRESGAIPESGGETWSAIENALRKGTRGLKGGSSLSRFIQAALAESK